MGIAFSASNSGGAWDNAKKIIEAERLVVYIQAEGKEIAITKDTPYFKDIKAAAVSGDTVGDPLKEKKLRSQRTPLTSRTSRLLPSLVTPSVTLLRTPPALPSTSSSSFPLLSPSFSARSSLNTVVLSLVVSPS